MKFKGRFTILVMAALVLTGMVMLISTQGTLHSTVCSELNIFCTPVNVGASQQQNWICREEMFLLDQDTVVDTEPPDYGDLQRSLTFVSEGGTWSPEICAPKHTVAIIVAYRNRWENLKILLRYLHPFLKRQQLRYRIFVVEQWDLYPFNRAKLFNIGYKEALKFEPFDCFIFHDVDFVPENDHNMYDCVGSPRHMIGRTVKPPYINITIPEWFFGGVVALTPDHIELVNGWSNKYYGWGDEDGDLKVRVKKGGLKYTRADPLSGGFKHLGHEKQERNRKRTKLIRSIRTSNLKVQKEGLTNVNYSIVSIMQLPLFTHIKADVKMTEEEKKLTSLCDFDRC